MSAQTDGYPSMVAPAAFSHDLYRRQLPLLLTFGFLFTANAYSWLITSQGMIVSQRMPRDIDFLLLGINIPGEVMSYLISAIMQGVILLFYANLPTFRPKTLKMAACLIPFILMFITSSLIFSLFSITYRAESNHYYMHVANRLAALNTKMTGLDRTMIQAFKGQVDEYTFLANESRQGRDRSGIKRCGPMCQGYWDKYHELVRSYQSVLARPISPITATSQNVMATWIETQARRNALHGKVDSFNTFASQEGLSIDLSAAREAISHDYQALGMLLETQSSVTKGSMILSKVLDDLRQLIIDPSGVSLSTYMNIQIAALPDLLSLACAILIWWIRNNRTDQTEIKRQIKELQEEEKLLDELDGKLWSVIRMRIKAAFTKSFKRW